MPLSRSCPLCDNGRARPIWHEAGSRYLRCSACGMVFADIDPRTYERVSHNAWDDATLESETLGFYGDARAKVHGQFLEHLGPGAGRSLFDVGSGLGFFLERAAAAGWDVRGCDTSPSWVEQARRRVGEGRVALGGARPQLFGGRRYDLITLWDVIEHIHDPLDLLRQVTAMLRPGGQLFLRTPNLAYVWPVYALRRRFLRHEVELGPRNHVVYFTAATMTHALSLVGLRPLAWPVFVPPQVSVAGWRNETVGPSVGVKNAYAALASIIADMTDGRVVGGSDLDVFAWLADS